MTNTMILAGGCFWCVEHDMKHAPGVTDVVSGYSGGDFEEPTYENHPGHREVVWVTYDPEVTNYKKLAQYFLDHIDPTDDGGQFGDRGESYKTAIFYRDKDEKHIAEALLQELSESGLYEREIAVEILERKPFYRAEDYHQKYAEDNPVRYQLYREGSGREGFVGRTCALREEKHIEWKD